MPIKFIVGSVRAWDLFAGLLYFACNGTVICYFVNWISEAFQYFLQVILMNLCGNIRVCFQLFIRLACMYNVALVRGGDETCCILVSPFWSSLKFSMVGGCKCGLKISCFVEVSIGKGNFVNSVIFGVVRSCRHGLGVLVLCGSMKMAICSS